MVLQIFQKLFYLWKYKLKLTSLVSKTLSYGDFVIATQWKVNNFSDVIIDFNIIHPFTFKIFFCRDS